MTRVLVFNYIVMENDNSKRLDYVDTRLHPYNLPSFQLSLALNTDVNRYFIAIYIYILYFHFTQHSYLRVPYPSSPLYIIIFKILFWAYSGSPKSTKER